AARLGKPGEAVLHRMLERAREQLGAEASTERLVEQARHGIVFVDEVDKIRAWVGDQPNISGIRAQEALLTVMENEAVPLELPQWAGGGQITVDSSQLLFVCGGAFEGLYDAVFDRVTIGKDKGALQAKTVVEGGQVREILDFHLRDWVRNEDLFDYGMSPQFLSRFDAVVMLQDLRVQDLEHIFLQIADSGYHQAAAFEVGRAPYRARSLLRAEARRPRLERSFSSGHAGLRIRPRLPRQRSGQGRTGERRHARRRRRRTSPREAPARLIESFRLRFYRHSS
ncbi:MAG: AAA family ATPase, partial [Acidobacteriota bacterium]